MPQRIVELNQPLRIYRATQALVALVALVAFCAGVFVTLSVSVESVPDVSGHVAMYEQISGQCP